ncbi:MAG: porin [Tabrizicola sp.]|jgi:outer membrane protein OmpU|nr:porin [Tabrizicola sp.]
MKHLLVTTTILALSAGFAAAEVTLSGDARMGIINNFGDDDTGFTSRARVKFTLSGETDTGLSFGASFRADNASAASAGNAGEVFISGAFGKLTMGDIDGAAQQAVGNVDGVGLTGLGDLNEAVYLHNLFDEGAFGLNSDPTAAYEYSTGGFTGIISVSNPDNLVGVDIDPTFALGLKYVMGDYTFALGYEDNNDSDSDHVIVGVNATFGAFTVKANYGQATVFGVDVGDQWHLSGTYSADALSVTAFVVNEFDAEAYGLGASYDLGGGAKVVGGYARNDSADTDAFDFGLSFSF